METCRAGDKTCKNTETGVHDFKPVYKCTHCNCIGISNNRFWNATDCSQAISNCQTQSRSSHNGGKPQKFRKKKTKRKQEKSRKSKKSRKNHKKSKRTSRR